VYSSFVASNQVFVCLRHPERVPLVGRAGDPNALQAKITPPGCFPSPRHCSSLAWQSDGPTLPRRSRWPTAQSCQRKQCTDRPKRFSRRAADATQIHRVQHSGPGRSSDRSVPIQTSVKMGRDIQSTLPRLHFGPCQRYNVRPHGKR